MHDRLKTKLELRRRHLDSDGICDRCGLDLESPLHVLRDCPVAKRIWNCFIPKSSQADFFLCLLRIGYFLIFEVRSRRAEMLIEAVFLVSLFGGFGIEGIIFNSITLMLTAITCFMTFV